MPVRDDYPEERESLSTKIESLKKTLAEVQQLQIKIKVWVLLEISLPFNLMLLNLSCQKFLYREGYILQCGR